TACYTYSGRKNFEWLARDELGLKAFRLYPRKRPVSSQPAGGATYSLFQGPKPGRAAYSARVSMLRRKNGRVCFVAENILLQSRRNILVDARNLRSSSTHHDYIRIKKVDEVC